MNPKIGSALIGATGNALNGGQGTGGSVNSGYTTSHSTSNTNGSAATIKAQQAAMQANQSAINAWKMAANYNSDEAAAQREWLEYMANTVYQRSVKDMKAAGINPILAAGMGLGTASVGSGAQASMANPAQFMSNTFADSNSAADSYGENHGSSWNETTSGLTTALTQIAGMITGALAQMNSGTVINNILDAYKESGNNYNKKTKEIEERSTGNDKMDNYRKKVVENNRKEVGNNKFLQFLNDLQLSMTGAR